MLTFLYEYFCLVFLVISYKKTRISYEMLIKEFSEISEKKSSALTQSDPQTTSPSSFEDLNGGSTTTTTTSTTNPQVVREVATTSGVKFINKSIFYI